MGMMSANENRVRNAASMLKNTLRHKYFLYGGTNRYNILKNSFIAHGFKKIVYKDMKQLNFKPNFASKNRKKRTK